LVKYMAADEPRSTEPQKRSIDQIFRLESDKKEDLVKRIIELEEEKSSLERQIAKYKTTRAAGLTLFLLGITILIIAIFYQSVITVLAGLGPAFLGGTLLYVRPSRHVRYELLHESNVLTCTLISGILKSIDGESKGFHLPSRTLKGLVQNLVFIPQKGKMIKPWNLEYRGDALFSRTPEGIFIPSPGSGLVRLFRSWLGKDPASLTPNELADRLTVFLVENLELLKDFEMEFKDNEVRVKFDEPLFMELCEEMREDEVCLSVGCPFCSFVASLLTRITNNVVMINEVRHGEREIETTYHIIKEAESQK